MRAIKIDNLLKNVKINDNDKRFKNSFNWFKIKSKRLIKIYFNLAKFINDEMYKSLFVIHK